MRRHAFRNILVVMGLLAAFTVLPGCLSKARAPMTQYEPEFSHVRDLPTLVLDDVYSTERPLLVSAK